MKGFARMIAVLITIFGSSLFHVGRVNYPTLKGLEIYTGKV